MSGRGGNTKRHSLDAPLDRPERPCAWCRDPFQPTIRRRMLCAPCFNRASGAGPRWQERGNTYEQEIP